MTCESVDGCACEGVVALERRIEKGCTARVHIHTSGLYAYKCSVNMQQNQLRLAKHSTLGTLQGNSPCREGEKPGRERGIHQQS